jgi:hypothetical protein
VNRLEAVQFLTISATMTNREPTEEAASAWSLVLDDIPLDAALTALREHYRMSRFPVMPADILAHVNEAAKQAERDEQRAVNRERQRASNRDHRRQMIADGFGLRDDDVVWPDVGWTGDDQSDDSVTSTVPASTIASRSA